MDSTSSSECAMSGGAKEVIETQSKIRQQLTDIQAQWNELNHLYQIEAKKRRVLLCIVLL